MRTRPPVRTEPRTRDLASPGSLTALLARGALLSPFKRPGPDARPPATRLTLSGVRVDLAHLAAYERVCGFPTGRAALPVTYPHVLAFPLAMRIMTGRAFPLPLLGLVHTAIEITQHREPTTAAAYELAVLVEKLAPHRRGTEATVRTEARVHGELVWESRSTYLARHRPRDPVRRNTPRGAPGELPPDIGEVASRAASREARPDSPRTAPPGLPWEARPSASSEERRPLPALREWHLAADTGRRYGAVSGDRNPIHLHPLTARLFGFPHAIAHGMWTVARCLAEYGPPESVGVRAEFRAPVALPGTATYAARGASFELRTGDRVHVTGDVRPLPARTE
ncbi:MaoC/PaaZ C-terminal domain-containing protein [Streptomyces sp. NPDC002580]|uniref:MaoC/PaaZ C-terminal domain-containing protein n=1 Tax=Streptomyces sp. NPDC002580 TaxID=3364653 RepID=UPI0036BDC54E